MSGEYVILYRNPATKKIGAVARYPEAYDSTPVRVFASLTEATEFFGTSRLLQAWPCQFMELDL